MYGFGVVGNMGGGVLDFIATNWIPLGKSTLDDICLSSSNWFNLCCNLLLI